MGYEFWYQEDGSRKVTRVKDYAVAANDENASGGIKEFHAFIVWDYQEESIRLLNITQKSIQKAIFEMTTSEEWGDPTGYDVVIKRDGKGLDTEYVTNPLPPKELTKDALEAYNKVIIDDEQYFSGGHPIVREDSEDISGDLPF